MKLTRCLLSISLLACCLLATEVLADPQSRSFSHWRFNESGVEATFTIELRELTRLPAYGADPDTGKVWINHLRQTIQLHNAGSACTLASAQQLPAKEGSLQALLRLNCDGALEQVHVSIAVLLAQVPSHVHFARFDHVGAGSFERLFSHRNPVHTVDFSGGGSAGAASHGSPFLDYVVFGFEHILEGLDHLAFLLALMLLVTRLRDILWLVTGFTLGHSFTLALAALGIVQPNMSVVEALIGFTIALVAIENIPAREQQGLARAVITAFLLVVLAIVATVAHLRMGPLALLGLALFTFCYLRIGESPDQVRRMRPLLTTVFGLVHGFGFASVLMEVGVPDTAVVQALLGFNVGVELGQVAIVLAISLAGLLLSRVGFRWREGAGDVLSAALCGLGVFWFTQRLLV